MTPHQSNIQHIPSEVDYCHLSTLFKQNFILYHLCIDPLLMMVIKSLLIMN